VRNYLKLVLISTNIFCIIVAIAAILHMFFSFKLDMLVVGFFIIFVMFFSITLLRCVNCGFRLFHGITDKNLKEKYFGLSLEIADKCPNCRHDPFVKLEHKNDIKPWEGHTTMNKKNMARGWIVCAIFGVPMTLYMAWLQYTTWPPIVLDDGQDVTKFGLAFMGFMVLAFIGLGIRGLIWLRRE